MRLAGAAGCLAGGLLAIQGCAAPLGLQQALVTAQSRWKRALCLQDPLPRVRLDYRAAPMACADNLAWGCHGRGWIAISTSVPQDHWLPTLTHEYGHELDDKSPPGAPDHVHDGEGIMASSNAVMISPITQADIDLVCTYRVCECERPEQ